MDIIPLCTVADKKKEIISRTAVVSESNTGKTGRSIPNPDRFGIICNPTENTAIIVMNAYKEPS